jgi:RND family efflux transporter MFP subunit
MTKSVSRLRAGLLLPAAALLGLAAGCQGPADGPPATGTAMQPATAASASPAVPVIRPERKTVRYKIEQPAFNIEAFQETAIYPYISGYALWSKWHKVDIGDRVNKDQVLVELYVPQMVVAVEQKEAAIRQAKAQIDVARAAVLNAKALLDRFESQYKRLARVQQQTGTLDTENVAETRLQYEASAAGLAKATADVTLAQAQLEVAKSDRDFAKTMLQFAQLPAPFAGVVTQRHVNDGDFVQPAGIGSTGQPLFVISQIDPVRVFVKVPGTYAPWIQDGDAVTLLLQGAGGDVIEGKVTRNARSLNPTERTLRTEIDLSNPKGRLLPGMYVQASIKVEHRNVWTLPEEAVVTEGDQTVCYRVVEDKAVRTPLQIGLRGGGLVQVLKKELPATSPGAEPRWEDISGDEDVVASNLAALHNGQAVQAKKAEK